MVTVLKNKLFLGSLFLVFILLLLFANSQKLPTNVLTESEVKVTLERAKRGDTSATWAMYENYDEVGDKKNALVWLREGSRLSDARSQYQIYSELQNSINKSDTDEAFLELKKAAERGHQLAILRLGQEYKEGRLVHKNIDAATEWLDKAASVGDIEAVLELADIYTYYSTDLKKAFGYVSFAKALSSSNVYESEIQTKKSNIEKQAALMKVDSDALVKQGLLYAENLKKGYSCGKLQR